MKLTVTFTFVCFILFIVFPFSTKAQILQPVKWIFSTEKAGNETTLLLTATIDKPWHLYSQDIGDGGPIPTSFKFLPSENYELIGKVTEPTTATFHDPNFDMDLKTFDTKVTFRQLIKIKSKQNFSVKGSLEFMACNDKMCLPPDEIPFEIKIDDGSRK